MTKLAAVETTKDQKVRDAKRAFLLGLMDLSWKLAGAFLLPTLAGIAVDRSRGGDSQAFTIAGLAIGFVLAFLLIIKIGLDSNKEQA